jgi:hypothetical protein
MKSLFVLITMLLLVPLTHAAETPFAAVDVYIDTNEPIAAWQFELLETNASMKVVGVENGESAAFDRAPYYDREAVQLGTADRIVVAAYSLAERQSLPSGRTRVATIHVMLAAGQSPEYRINLIAAAAHDGQHIDAIISVETSKGTEE